MVCSYLVSVDRHLSFLSLLFELFSILLIMLFLFEVFMIWSSLVLPKAERFIRHLLLILSELEADFFVVSFRHDSSFSNEKSSSKNISSSLVVKRLFLLYEMKCSTNCLWLLSKLGLGSYEKIMLRVSPNTVAFS